jgi:hypothetical protein
MPRATTPMKRSGKVKAKRGTSTASLKRRATVLHSQYVRARDGRCVRCGSTTGQLQCAHIVSRRYAATRVDPGNAACLDAACHRRLTEHPHEHVGFFTAYLGSWEAYQALIDKANSGVGIKFNADYWQQQIDVLLALLEDVNR